MLQDDLAGSGSLPQCTQERINLFGDLGLWDKHFSISPDHADFVGPMASACMGMYLKGIVKGLSIQGQGHVMWAILDTCGQARHEFAY
jgi:hypothetical protein